MDLRTNQEVMGVQSRYPADYGTHIFKVKKTFEETDIKGNNNLFNSLKTEANSNHSHNLDSLFQEKRSNEKKLERDSPLLSYSSFKKAMDLRTHNRTLDGGRRTIFEDAEYFAKNHCYKLLPITFEQVDEVIIQSEHNYSLYSLTSESEAEEDCSRMMDYAQVREKNYKRRRTKFREGSDREELPEGEAAGTHSRPGSGDGKEQVKAPQALETENSAAIQPLDLSAAPPVQDDKTDEPSPAERPEGDETVQVDSDKENVNSDTNGIRVTITRPDEKGSYQPCDLFLNDIARLVPWLIDKDCVEVDILDRTCDRRGEFPKHRLYYVISEATWRLFQGTNERVILTNDRSLGQPLRKVEKVERPSYLVFDQLSLAKCLAEYCQEIGGCFEYTCVEEGKEEEEQADAVELEEGQRRAVKVKEGEIIEERMEELVEGKEKSKQNPGEEQVHKKTPKEEHEEVREESEGVKKEEEKKKVKEVKVKTEKIKKKEKNEENEVKKKKEVEGRYAEEETPEKPGIPAPSSEKQVSFVDGRSEGRGESVGEEGGEEQEGTRKGASSKPKRREGRGVKPKKSFPIQPKPKISRAATARSKSTSESETSQNGDKGVGRKRGGSALPKAEPPRKVKKPPSPEGPRRRTRSGRALEEAKGGEPTAGGSRGERRGRGGGGGTGRTLRSGRVGEGEEGRGRSKRRAGGGGGRGRRCVG